MPAAVPVTNRANEMIDLSDPESHRAAHEALRGASSVRHAIERANLLDEMEAPIVAEALAVLAALPQAIDVALLATLQSALERRIPTSVEWEEGPVIGLRVHEATDGPGQVTVVLITPHGSQFVS